MRKRTITVTFATGLLAAVALTGCTATNDSASNETPVGSATSSPAPDAKQPEKSGTDVRAAAGVADVTGKCVDGESTPIQNGKEITIGDCALVDVMGSKNTITAGKVTKLTIEGSNNTVTVQSTTEVTTLGNDNTIIYVGGKEPAFNEHATGNTVTPADK